MSNTPFTESLSADPVERAIADKANRILNDTSLDRLQRESLIKNLQRELLRHRQQQQGQLKLQQQVAAMRFPPGCKPQSIQVRDGRVQVAVMHRNHSFTWLDAGEAPVGVAANHSSFAPLKLAKDAAKRRDIDPIAVRQQELGLKPVAPGPADFAA